MENVIAKESEFPSILTWKLYESDIRNVFQIPPLEKYNIFLATQAFIS